MRAALAALAVLATLAVPQAAPAKPGAFSPVDCPAGCGPVDGTHAAVATAVSPDGRFLYVAYDDHVRTFALDATRGTFAANARRSCVGDIPGCTPIVGGLGLEIHDFALSRDGAVAYAATSAGLRVLARNASSGSLTPTSCVPAPFQTCTTGAVALRVVVTAADRATVLWAGAAPTWLVTSHARSGGALVTSGCLSGSVVPTCTQASDHRTATMLTMAGTGDSLYLGGRENCSVSGPVCGVVLPVAVAAGGALSDLAGVSGCVNPGPLCPGGPYLDIVQTLGAHARSVLVAGQGGGARLLARQANGTLGAELPCDGHVPCMPATAAAVHFVAGTPDTLFVADADLRSLRVTATGASQVSCAGAPPCQSIPSASGPPAVSPNGRFVYLGAPSPRAFLTDRPPTCAKTVGTWVRTTSLLPACSDPNGERLTYKVVTAPKGGGLTAVAGGLRYRAPTTTGIRSAVVTVFDGGTLVKATVAIDVRKTPKLSFAIAGLRSTRGTAGRRRYAVPFGKAVTLRLGAPSGRAPMPSARLEVAIPRGTTLVARTGSAGKATVSHAFAAPGVLRLSAPTIARVRALRFDIVIVPVIDVTRAANRRINGAVRAGSLRIAGTVRLQRRTGSRWTTVATSTKPGAFSFAPTSGRLRIQFVPRARIGLATATRAVPS